MTSTKLTGWIKKLLRRGTNPHAAGRPLGYKIHNSDVVQNDFVFLKDMGLQPHHRILDIGCGGGRLGIPLIQFMQPGHYYAIDKESHMIDAFRKSVSDHNLNDKNPNIKQTDFDFDWFGDVKFDFLYAYSVFTHNTPDQIALCLRHVRRILNDNGRFFATFHLGSKLTIGEEHSNRPNEYSGVWYRPEDMEQIAAGENLKARYIGNDSENWEGVQRRLLDPKISSHKSDITWSPFFTKECEQDKCAASPHTHGRHQEMMEFTCA